MTPLEHALCESGIQHALSAQKAAFDSFILPSNKEGIGGIRLDAMDCALPIIASRVGGLPEIVRDGENGLLIDPGQPDQLEEAIIRVYDAPDTRRAMGARGR